MDCKNISGTVMTIRIGIIGEEVAVEAGRDMIVIDPTEVRGNATEVGVVVLVLTAVKIVGGEEMMMNDVVLANLIEGTQIYYTLNFFYTLRGYCIKAFKGWHG